MGLQYIIDSHGKRQSIVLNIHTYEEMLEEIDDLKTIAERQKEPSVPLAQFEAKLKKRGGYELGITESSIKLRTKTASSRSMPSNTEKKPTVNDS